MFMNLGFKFVINKVVLIDYYEIMNVFKFFLVFLMIGYSYVYDLFYFYIYNKLFSLVIYFLLFLLIFLFIVSIFVINKKE